MPNNDGTRPPVDRADIRYRNGTVERSIDPAKRRWTLDDPKFGKGYAWDIVSWQWL